MDHQTAIFGTCARCNRRSIVEIHDFGTGYPDPDTDLHYLSACCSSLVTDKRQRVITIDRVLEDDGSSFDMD
jgi:hypothetical protein